MKRIYVIAINIGYWLLFILLLILIYIASQINTLDGPPVYKLLILTVGFILIPSLVSFYGSYSIVFRLFVQKVNNGLILLSLLVLSVFSVLLALLNVYAFIGRPTVLLEVALVSFLLNSFNILVGFILHSFVSWFSDLRKKEELSQKTKTLELELLKLKLDPHFLFNTINNIDVLIETDSKKASEYIIKLSSILRFYLYKSSESKIKLSDEISYIKEYVDLQKIRTSNEDFVNLNITGDSKSKEIYPMIFIPFIENAFKHSKNKKSNSIDIQILILDSEVHFSCCNKFEQTDLKINGIGNQLIEDRLDLFYSDRYKMNVNISEEDYLVELKIAI